MSATPPLLDPLFLTHNRQSHLSLEDEIQKLKETIRQQGDLPHTTIKEQLELLNDLAQFPLGQFLIQNKGLNGLWTDYILMHAKRGRVTDKPLSTLEDFMLNRAPTVLATQERFGIFQEELQKRCQNGVTLASIPCGLMSDLLTLDTTDCELLGIDIDKESLEKVSCDRVITIEGDAWTTPLPHQVDVITSNGLNIYEPDETRVIELYRQFYDNLKPGGTLITSFLTPPPALSSDSEWILDKINPEDARLQKVIFADILAATWQVYRTSEETTRQLEIAGFHEIEIIKGKAGIFPTVIAHKLF